MYVSCVCVQIREEIDKFGIKVYQLPECDSDEDEEFKQLDKELKVSVCTQIYPLLLHYNGLIIFSLVVKNTFCLFSEFTNEVVLIF